ncbi:MAG: hypothetical protein AAGD10_02535 [Myxococcota bacterium]
MLLTRCSPIFVGASALLFALASACGGEDTPSGEGMGSDGNAGGGNGSGNGGTGAVPPVFVEAMPDFISPDRLTTTFDVEFKPELRRIGEAERAALLLVDDQRQEYTFDATMAAGLGLEPGAVVLIDNLALFEVLGVEQEGDVLKVQTATVSLERVIQEGEIGFDYELDLVEAAIRAGVEGTQIVQMDGGGLSVATEGSGLLPAGDWKTTFNGQNGEVAIGFKVDGVDYEMKLKPSQTKTEILMNFVKKTQTGQARFSFIGELSAPRATLNVSYASGKAQSGRFETNGMSGKLRFEIFGGGTGADDIVINIPFPVFKLPFSVGPVPMELGIGVGSNMKANLPGNASVQFTNEMDFDTVGGIDFENARYDGMATTFKLKDGTADLAKGVGLPTIGAGLQVEAPKITLGALKSSVAVGVKIVFESVANLRSVSPFCQKLDFAMRSEGSASLSVFGGFSLAKTTGKFWEHKDSVASTDPRCGY